MAEILIGTCGYSYNEWVGPVYPEGTKTEQLLPLYASRFKTVELDYTYYAMPKAKNIQQMIDDGPGLSFAIKAHQSLTHKIDSAKWQNEAKTYIQAIQPLREKGLLETLDRRHSKAEVRQSVFSYIKTYYNRVPMHSAFGNVAPDVYNSGNSRLTVYA